jgi:beta-lactamase superfamily II metal-dependent hydrolase
MSPLVVRVYDVRFGDAVFVSIPDTKNSQPVERTILFDYGNALGTEGGANAAMTPVAEDIVGRLGGEPLDLYVMTHEHLDHVQGPLFANQQLGVQIKARQVWLTGSSAPGYYASHPDARKQKIAALAAYRRAAAALQDATDASPFLGVLLANNNPAKTADCIDYLRANVADPADVHYVDRTTDLSTLQPASSATLTLWAPEEDTADYYGKFKPIAAGLGIDDTYDFDDLDGPRLAEAPEPKPLGGIDAGAFYNLLDVRRGATSTLLSIDQAANNTSVVTLLEWNGWRLLFSGDAEKRSWRQMAKVGVVAPVHFLKVSHHGSHTGMPPDDILDDVLPRPAPGATRSRAAVSTYPNTYPGVPDGDTLDGLRERVDLRSTRDLQAGELFVELTFDEAGPPP